MKWSRDTTGAKIELRDKVRWLKVSRFGWYKYRHSLSKEEPWKEVCVLSNQSLVLSVPPLIELLPRRTAPIKKSKLEDILKQLRFIPAIYQGLYLSLKTGDSAESTSEPHQSVDEVC